LFSEKQQIDLASGTLNYAKLHYESKYLGSIDFMKEKTLFEFLGFSGWPSSSFDGVNSFADLSTLKICIVPLSDVAAKRLAS
jgi:hypothetical protein